MREFECYICKKPFKKNSSLIRHITDQHNTKWWKCAKCGTRIKNKNNFDAHKKKCTKTKISLKDASTQTEAMEECACSQRIITDFGTPTKNISIDFDNY